MQLLLIMKVKFYYLACFLFLYSILKEKLMKGDFPSNVKLLQNFPSNEIQKIIPKAVELSKYLYRRQ